MNVSLRQFLLILIPRHDMGEGQGGETTDFVIKEEKIKLIIERGHLTQITSDCCRPGSNLNKEKYCVCSEVCSESTMNDEGALNVQSKINCIKVRHRSPHHGH